MIAVMVVRALHTILATWFLLVTPLAATAGDAEWLGQITELVMQHQAVAEQYGSGDAYGIYVKHLDGVRQSLSQDDTANTYRLMNQFMDMLEMRVAGIPGWSARALYDYCGRVTPPMYHDVSRHLPRT